MVLKRGAGRLQIKPIGPGDEHGYNHLLLYGKTSLIGSFSVGILHIWYGPHGNGPSRVFFSTSDFCFGAKPANSNFATKTAKKKMWILSFLIAKLPEKAKKIEILLRFQRWMTKTNILRARSMLSWTSGNFWCRNWNRHRRKPGGQRRFYQPTEKCKHRRLLIWTLALLRYIEANGMKTGKTESLPPSELYHFLSKFAWTHGWKTEKNKNRLQFPVFSPV